MRTRLDAKGWRAGSLALLFTLTLAAPARAAWQPEGVDLSRPRILYRAEDLEGIRARIDADPEAEPYVTLFRDMAARIAMTEGISLEDDAIASQRFKARAAKNLAFQYAIDRTLVGGRVVPFPSAAEREAAGDEAAMLLLSMYEESRLGVEPPVGGWDRDISTSEELLQFATVYDTLLGAGYDFGDDEEAATEKLVNLASDFYDDYVNEDAPGHRFVSLHQNNHRSKSGAALVIAAIALAEYTPAPGSDPRGVRDPALWLEFGLEQTDLITRWVLGTGDGTYAEGPFYDRFASQNLLPFARAWDRLVDGAAWTALGLRIPSWWRHPMFRMRARWMLDMTLPDGSFAPIDDGNVGRSFYFGALPNDHPDAEAFAWRWANAPQRYESDGNVDMAADQVVNHDPDLVPAPPEGSPSAIYPEGGHAIFRSDWSADGVVAVVLGEHDTASEFGRDREGLGVSPESHEHAEPGAFLLHAFGERLAMDPGFLTVDTKDVVNQPKHHNLILVDGQGPASYLGASAGWPSVGLDRRPLADGQATLSDWVDGGFLDAVRVSSRYGEGIPPDLRDGPLIRRRFLFPDHRYLAIADTVRTKRKTSRDFTWLVHGNGGATSGGSYASTATGGRWARRDARLDAGFAFDTGPPVLSTSTSSHEAPGKVERQHTVLEATVRADRARSAAFVYPTRSGEAQPEIDRLDLGANVAALRLVDPDGDRRVLLLHREPGGDPLTVDPAVSDFKAASTDAALALFDAHADGTLRLAWVEDATTLSYDGMTPFTMASPTTLGIRYQNETVELFAGGENERVEVADLPFEPRSADGVCSLAWDGRVASLVLGRERRVRLRAATGNARPAADPGPDRYVLPGAELDLDGRGSCDSDGDELSPSWTLVSAPRGSDFALERRDSWTPRLLADRVGPYRVRLVVTDSKGAASLPVELRVVAGYSCDDGIDNDLDGVFDHQDAGCGPGLSEAPACDDGIDNDRDGDVDAGEDAGCRTPSQFSEEDPSCGLGVELVLLPMFRVLRRRKRGEPRPKRLD